MTDHIDWAVRKQPLGSRPAPIAPGQQYPPAYGPSPARPKRRHTGLIVGLAVAVIILAGAVTAGVLVLTGSIGTKTFDVHGTLYVHDCTSSLGYGDIHAGVPVTVSDEKGAVLATGRLTDQGVCTWAFTVANVPAGHSLYSLSVGRRGDMVYSEDELRADLELGLG